MNYYSINKPERTTINLARYSHSYIDYLYNKIYLQKSGFSRDPLIRNITQRTLLITAENTNGLVKYVKS